jgi:hypothetical protein
LKRRSIGIAVIGSVLWLSALARAQSPAPPETVVAWGESTAVRENPSGARGEALEKALSSVNFLQAEKLVAPSVWSEVADVVGRRLAGDPRPYIQDFRVLREERSGDKLRIEVGAVPRVGKLREELLRWGILYDRPRRPRIAVAMIHARRPGGPMQGAPSPQWTGLLAARLRSLGFSVHELGIQPPSGMSNGIEGADLVVTGFVSAYGDRAVSADLSGSAGNPPVELARLQSSFPLEGGADLASGLIVSGLLENLLPAWFRAHGEGKEYSVGFTGVKSYKQYTEISGTFQSGRNGFASGMERAYSAGKVVFRVVFGGSVEELAAALASLPLTEGRVEVTGISGDTVSATVR